ncbi:MAG: S46 family peptidase, partial [Myxococcota bacterium]
MTRYLVQMRAMRTLNTYTALVGFGLTSLLASCGSSNQAAVAPTATASAEPATTSFANPGGMWMPQQMGDHTDTLRTLGLEVDPQQLTDPSSPLLSSIVSLGGCSASLVSPDGLIITNHHCVQGALQYHSSAENNLVEDGFLAKTRAEEKWNGPSARVYITQRMTDVTGPILDGVAQIADDRQRFDEIERREKKLISECEKDRPEIRCRVASYFRGAEYYLIETLQIRDVRLVYAPPYSIGFYGGDQDNWMWP